MIITRAMITNVGRARMFFADMILNGVVNTKEAERKSVVRATQ